MSNSTALFQETSVTVMFILACLLILVTIIGNVLVIVAFAKEESLQVLTNYWIISLSCTDLVLATTVMPVYIVDEVNGDSWQFGQIFCDIFITMDVLCCTCSIYHLVLISLDRYFCVRHPLTYPQRRTRQGTLIAISCTWTICAIISVPRLMGWKDGSGPNDCRLTNTSYKVFSSLMSFYLPTLLIFWTYLSICLMTQRQSRRMQKYSNTACRSPSYSITRDEGQPSRANGPGLPLEVPKTSVEMVHDDRDPESYIDESTTDENQEKHEVTELLETPKSSEPIISDRLNCDGLNKKFRLSVSSFDLSTGSTAGFAQKLTELSGTARRFMPTKTAGVTRLERNRQRQEQKAAKVVAVVVSVYLISWTPFFVTNIYDAMRRDVSPVVWRGVTWLGYANSAVNPVIYTLFNQTFRQTIALILGCRSRGTMRRTRRVIIG